MLVLPISQNSAWFELSCELDGVTIDLTFRWNDRSERWYFDVADARGEVRAASIAATTGWPLLSHVRGVDGLPPGELFIIDAELLNEDPTFDSLGRRHLVMYATAQEMASLQAA